MTQPQTNPLASRAFSLEFPQSLGTFREYAEVQRLVDTLADHGFPVQNTLIVGTDLKLVERVTGRKTWGRVIGGGLISGLWLGLFVGLLFGLFSDNWGSMLVSSVLMGMVFFTVWAAIGHAFSGGTRDFTSMTATIPMQYELLVEHRHLLAAQQVLRENNVPLGPGAFGGGSSAPAGPTTPGAYGQPGPATAGESAGADDTASRRPSFGLPSDPSAPSSPTAPSHGTSERRD
ncbi:MAG: hypothetical protein Q4G21_01790 [Dermabacter sp.]|nr:hypothetical protein [Dermabacter sp.]